MVNVGSETITETVLVLGQPKAFTPVTVYTVLTKGATDTDEPTKAPGFQV